MLSIAHVRCFDIRFVNNNGKCCWQTDRELDIFVKWTYCALSHLPLQKPIVSCELGR